MAYPTIDDPVSCEIHAIIRLLHTKKMNAEEIHCE
jgi:hypothetical protein